MKGRQLFVPICNVLINLSSISCEEGRVGNRGAPWLVTPNSSLSHPTSGGWDAPGTEKCRIASAFQERRAQPLDGLGIVKTPAIFS